VTGALSCRSSNRSARAGRLTGPLRTYGFTLNFVF
jgi:hypothetical protein